MTTLALLLAWSLRLSPLAAQGRPTLSLEPRGGLVLPMGAWRNDNSLSAGFGAGLTAQVSFPSGVRVYAGWDRTRFSLVPGALKPGADSRIIDSGFRAGLTSARRLPFRSPVEPFLTIGGVLHRHDVRLRGSTDTVTARSKRDLGFEAGVGMTARLGGALRVTPSIRYRSRATIFPFTRCAGVCEGGTLVKDQRATIDYVLIDVGIVLPLSR